MAVITTAIGAGTDAAAFDPEPIRVQFEWQAL
jgi:hypothetical protein